MGASQSSASAPGNHAASSSPEAKQSYYQLLGIDKSASDDEIKKAYRRKALELHPDRNFGNVESATRLFAEVQSAYEVLSDPQERAWYDSHETVILRGDDVDEDRGHDSHSTTTDDILRSFAKFNRGVDFSDSPSGFFGYLRELFERLAGEEIAACQRQGIDIVDYPSFGRSDDSFETVKPFYSAWVAFSTRKSFAWKDIYRYSEAPDRRVRRAMEKENKRLREDGVREYNDAIRSLIAFVRKRDPRYISSSQSEAERQKFLKEASIAQAARDRAANKAKIQDQEVPDWAVLRDEDEEEDTESQTDEEQFECVACGKLFKSEKQFEAHERSKKHLKALQQLRREMRTEDAALNLHEPLTPPKVEAIRGDSESDTKNSSLRVLEEAELTHQNIEEIDQSEGIEPLSSVINPVTTPTSGDSDSSDDDYAPRKKVEERMMSNFGGAGESKETTVDRAASVTDDLSNVSLDGSEPPRKVGKAKEKRAKKAARKAANEGISEASIPRAVS